MHSIGFIGLGVMGKPMALNLIHAGYSLHVYARRLEMTEPLVQAGAKAYNSPQELAANAAIIFIIVPTTNDVEEVILGKYGIIHSAKPDTIVIDMGTTSATATQRIAQHLAKNNIAMLDAPVSGAEQAAITGTLSFMVGGKAEILKKVKPVLQILGKHITYVGEHGAGQIAKACHQLIVAETIIAVSEALYLAKSSNVDPAKVREALLHSLANSPILESHGQRMLENNYQEGFKASIHRKDLHLAMEQAHQMNIFLPAADFAMHCLDRLVLKGHSDLDSSALHLMAADIHG